jgi:hypothetical protein
MSFANPPTVERAESARYAKCVEISKRNRWDIERDLIRGRTFDHGKKFLPDGLSLVHALDFLGPGDRRLLSQIQGRSYANLFGLLERFINAKVLELTQDHCLGDQTALEALVRFSEEELKHQAMFRRIEAMIGERMPPGYRFVPDPNAVARAVLSKSTWSVLALTCHIELFTQAHYKQSIAPDPELSELFKDVFLYHWREESQHAILDELEWLREHRRLSEEERDQAVNDLIDLVAAVDGILQVQSDADGDYFLAIAAGPFGELERQRVRDGLLKAYRRQYIVSGLQEPRFAALLGSLVTPEQGQRIASALAPILR